MTEKLFIHKVTTRKQGIRLDRYLTELGLGLSRSQLKELILKGQVLVNRKPVKPHYVVRTNEEISIHLPLREKPKYLPEPISLDIVYEDSHLLVVNKRAGMVVHPACGHYTGTLVNALLYHCQSLSTIGGESRPGIVHRLDKDTSGLLVVAKTDEAHQALARQLEERRIKRLYHSLVWGRMGMNLGRVEAPIGRYIFDRKKMAVTPLGEEAVTTFRVLEDFGICSYLELKLLTGKTHQIRVHLLHLGHPVVGDQTYGGRKKSLFINLGREDRTKGMQLLKILKRQALHAFQLGFFHPSTSKYLEFTALEPEDIRKALLLLREGLPPK